MCEVIQKEKLPTIASANVVRALLEHSDLREGNKAFERGAHHGIMVMVFQQHEYYSHMVEFRLQRFSFSGCGKKYIW